MEHLDSEVERPRTISEMGMKIIQMFTDPARPHPHSIGYREKLMGRVETMRKQREDPTFQRPSSSASEFFSQNQAQYVYNDHVGSPPIVEIKSKSERERSQPSEVRWVVHTPSDDLLEQIRNASLRSKKNKKEKHIEKSTDEYNKRIEGSLVAAVDEELDIFAGIELSRDIGQRGQVAEKSCLFSDVTAGYSQRNEDTLQAVRTRLLDSAKTREQARSNGGSIVQKRALQVTEEDFMQETNSFGEKISTDMFHDDTEHSSASRGKRKSKKSDHKKGSDSD